MTAELIRGLVPDPSRMPSRAARPCLRLVDPDERFTVVCPSPRQSVQLTRRGRLVVTATVTFALVALAVLLATFVDAASTPIDRVSTVMPGQTLVSPGQTLSEVAVAHLPSLPIDEAVALIQLANGLNTDQVHSGQSLLIPAMR